MSPIWLPVNRGNQKGYNYFRGRAKPSCRHGPGERWNVFQKAAGMGLAAAGQNGYPGRETISRPR